MGKTALVFTLLGKLKQVADGMEEIFWRAHVFWHTDSVDHVEVQLCTALQTKAELSCGLAGQCSGGVAAEGGAGEASCSTSQA